MKTLHYNIHMWLDTNGHSNVDRVSELIEEHAPDVVTLVEVDEPWGNPVRLRRLAERIAYRWIFVPAFEYRGRGGFGNAILTRATIRSAQQWQLLPPSLYDGTEPTEPRTVALAEIELDQQVVTIGATHLPRQDADKRSAAADRLREAMHGLTGPWLICGDFNQPASAWLPSDFRSAPHPPVCTYPTRRPVEAIDYAIGSDLSIKAHALSAQASDHLPILVTTSGS